MEITYLGTGASEGIPSLFCRCRVCENARKKKGKEIKTRAGFVIDSDFAVDFSADTFCHAVKNNVDYSGIKYLLFTHSHEDHYYSDDLVARDKYSSMNRTTDILSVYGNAHIGDMFQSKNKSAEVQRNTVFHSLSAYTEYNLGEYTVIPLKSIHMTTEESQVFIIQKGGKTYFHGMDTSGLPQEAYDYIKDHCITLNAITLDLTFGLLKECYFGHNNFEQFLQMIKKLKAVNALNPKSKIVACHITHFCGSTHRELARELKKHGVLLAYDGMKIKL